MAGSLCFCICMRRAHCCFSSCFLRSSDSCTPGLLCCSWPQRKSKPGHALLISCVLPVCCTECQVQPERGQCLLHHSQGHQAEAGREPRGATGGPFSGTVHCCIAVQAERTAEVKLREQPASYCRVAAEAGWGGGNGKHWLHLYSSVLGVHVPLFPAGCALWACWLLQQQARNNIVISDTKKPTKSKSGFC